MKQEPTRRAVLAGGMASTFFGALGATAFANPVTGKGSFQGSGDPIVSMPPSVSASSSGKLHITVCPPSGYTPGVQYTVKLVRMTYTDGGQGQMTVSFNDEYLDGIADGEFETTVSFPANSGPKVVSVPLVEMNTNATKSYTAVAFNASASGAAIVQVTA